METLIIILLALLSGWLWFRLFRIRRGIRSLSGLLQSGRFPRRQELPSATTQDDLEKLTLETIDSITEAAMERAAAKGKQRIQSVLLDQVKDALFIVDEFQQIRFANAASRQLFPAKEIVGRQLIEVCLDHHISETVDLAMKTGGSIQDQFELSNDGRTLFVESGVIDPSYQIGDGAWVIIRDITTELQIEKTRRDFVANASHELRTPLTIIRGYLEMLEDSEEFAQPVGVMLKHTDRLSRIVDNMLTISKLETNDEEDLLKRSLFDIGECLFGITEHLQPIIDAQKVKITFELPEPEERMILGDRFYWDQIFFNLIENALKQNSSPGLRINVRVIHEEITGRFTIEIIDNGIGIPANDLGQVFKRFYSVDKSHTGVKGTGLGLSIVKRAVEAHNGAISVTSRPGERTCFTISLPGPPVNAPETTAK